MKASLKLVKGLLLLLFLVFLIAAYILFIPSTNQGGTLRIGRNTRIEQLCDTLDVKFGLNHSIVFNAAARFMGYSSPKPCKVNIQQGMSIYEVLRLLKNNSRQTVDIVIRSGWTREQLVHYLASRLEPDTALLFAALNNKSLLQSLRIDTSILPALIIPDTYNFYYSTSAEEILLRMAHAGMSFWQKKNITADSALKVYSLASIVEKESQKNDERPLIAGVYLNRLKQGMKLQADPTVNFALGQWRALLFKDLEVESPYNTYKYYGLPPGPICIPSVQAIQSVLSPAVHNYLFFVAKGDGSGYHRFSASDTEHYRNIALRKKELLTPR